MGDKESIGIRARKAATGAAGVAVATSGLSSCFDNGAVDPLPPPLQCNTVNAGQTLVASASKAANTITVTIENQTPEGLWTDSLAITNLVGVRVTNVIEPRNLSRESLVITLELEPPQATAASFTVVGQLQGFDQGRCAFTRTYNLTVSGDAVTIGLAGGAVLPLRARQRADIMVVRREDRMVELEAHTPYQGDASADWRSDDGRLIASGNRATWHLPETPGVYQVELVMDYGDDGLAFATLAFEVGPDLESKPL